MTSIINGLKADKKYISETDTFLTQFDKKNPSKSPSQQKEIENYQALYQQRDTKIINKSQ
ncbi:CBU_0585 family protein [Rickettsiella endosymbiont of Dermanyssus gallinae]|uniref:CBU_0585 family protein n=1 Tax=Rickettsiella endosymbiont of Dermanyssus gallinae TaxID=2856608 RepID=UPI001C530B85|nr:CBU_0585 family protein [Rickettsiella endosymbiont of Dermanyssus gallinae]